MEEITRRHLMGATAIAGSAALLAAQEEPSQLRGMVTDGKVSLPPLHNPSESGGQLPNPEPSARRLGLAVVGLGHLALEQILPGFGQAHYVRLAALVSGEPDKAHTIAAQYNVPADSLYDYKSFDRLKDNPQVDIVYIVLPNFSTR